MLLEEGRVDDEGEHLAEVGQRLLLQALRVACVCMDGRIKCMDGWMDGWMDACMHRFVGVVVVVGACAHMSVVCVRACVRAR